MSWSRGATGLVLGVGLPMLSLTGLGVAASYKLVPLVVGQRAVLLELGYAGGCLSLLGGVLAASALSDDSTRVLRKTRVVLGLTPAVVVAQAVSLPSGPAVTLLSALAASSMVSAVLLDRRKGAVPAYFAPLALGVGASVLIGLAVPMYIY